METQSDLTNFSAESPPRLAPKSQDLKVVAHRGGFQPENSKACFMKAFEKQVDGIELDVWMSADGSLFICHPGDCGELLMTSGKEELVQNQRDEDIQKIRLSDGSALPTLDWLVEASLEFPLTELHIELKNPQNEELNKLYDVARVVELTMQLLQRHDCVEKSHILSFDKRIIDEVRLQRQKTSVSLKVVQLYNFYDTIPLPPDRSEWTVNDTISISAFYASKELVNYCHENKTKVCVWIDTVSANVVEGEQHYRNMINLGVDYIVTDFPLEAKNFILQEEQKKKLEEEEKKEGEEGKQKKKLTHQVSGLSQASTSTASASQHSSSYFSKEQRKLSSSSLMYQPAL